ncbi:MAG: hypothetical protein EAZ07_09710 [Cytophagales bacterium]|nr:MAG: hypothetical protein EAZ07_09710 [Cytophagales bacterium]
MALNIGFILTTLLFLFVFYRGTERNKRVLVLSVLWIFLISTLAIFDFFQNTTTMPPRFAIVLIGNLFFIVYCYLQLKSVTQDYRYSMLVHSLRIAVEIGLYFLYLQKQIPEIMTFEGWNFDIIMGISALILFLSSYFFKTKPSLKLLLLWNFLGLMLLLNIVVIAILSAPLPFQQLSFDQPNVAVLEFPFILLPSFIVPIVILTHILSIKQLLTIKLQLSSI